MGTTGVQIELPNRLVQQADVAARVKGTDRTAIIETALERYLADLEDDPTFRDAVLEKFLRDDIDTETFEAFVNADEAAMITASKRLVHHGDELADELAAG